MFSTAKKVLLKNKKIIFALLFIALLFPLGIAAVGQISEGFKIERTVDRPTEINAHGVCRSPLNQSGSVDYFVPTKFASDWLAFRNNVPADVTLYNCPVTDCQGEWVPNTSGSGSNCITDTCSQAPGCNGLVNYDFTCRICTYTATYVHTTPAQNGGLACSIASGQTDNSYRCGIEVGGASSFLAGTMIWTPKGEQPIETIEVGDKVIGSGGTNIVLELKRNAFSKNVYGFNNTRLFVTDGHPFMTPEGWKAFEAEVARRINPDLDIGQLVVGDYILRYDGTAEKIETIYYEYMTVPVFNFHVSGSQDYYADGYWVHNK